MQTNPLPTKPKCAPKRKAKAAPLAPKPKLYKVLNAQGQSHHGGSLAWSLPKDGKPGDWHEITGKLAMCSVGLHLTNDPVKWISKQDGPHVFEAEYDGEIIEKADGGDESKVCVRRCRLTRRVDDHAELAALRIYLSGRHEMKDGQAWVSGNAVLVCSGSSSVVARGSSSVVAWGSSSVVAWESSSVVARGSSSVVARGSSSVEARGSSSVEARGSSSVEAWGSSSVEAWESSSVVAWESSSVEAWESSTLLTWSHGGTVALHGPLVVHIKRSGSKAECVVGT